MDDKAITIRQRQDEDLDQLAKILVEVHKLDGYPVEGVSDPVAWLATSNLIQAWVAEVDGNVVAQVALSSPEPSDIAPHLARAADHDQPLLVLGRLFVSPNARGFRLGSTLTQTATQYAQDTGNRAVLDVMDKDVAAIRTYERLGWIPLGQADHHFGDQAVEPATAYIAPTGPAAHPHLQHP